jgi:hypothetical protein
MYVRSCYAELFEACRPLDDAVILGTPGIGKSTAVFYFLWRLLNDDENAITTVVYRPQQIDDDVYFVFRRGGRATRASAAGVRELPDNSSVLQVFDGSTPLHTHTKRRTWLVSSPRKDVWGQWQKQTSARVFYMPTFSLEEIQRCRSVAFGRVRERTADLLFRRWGGSARFVLEWADPALQEQLIGDANSAAFSANLRDVVHAVATADGGGDKYSQSPHVLFHLTVQPGYRGCAVIFASDYCRDLVLSVLTTKGVGDVKAFLSAAESSVSLGSLRGHLFECLALSTMFSSARQVSMTALDGTGAVASEELHVRQVVVFDTVDELPGLWRENPRAVGRPRVPNWPTWDAITCDDGVLTFWQMTVSAPQTHGMNSKGLLKADVLLSAGAPPPRFVYVVLCDPGASYSNRSVRIDGGRPPDWAISMTQHMLTLDFGAGAVKAADGARVGMDLLDHQINDDALL